MSQLDIGFYIDPKHVRLLIGRDRALLCIEM